MGLTAIKVTVQHEERGRAAAASVLNQKGLGGTDLLNLNNHGLSCM